VLATSRRAAGWIAGTTWWGCPLEEGSTRCRTSLRLRLFHPRAGSGRRTAVSRSPSTLPIVGNVSSP